MEAKVIDEEIKIGLITVDNELWGENFKEFNKEVESFAEQGILNVIADLTETEFISSEGMGAFATSHKHLSQSGGMLIVVCDNDDIVGLFITTLLDKKIVIVKTRDEAISVV